jgi:asparagine synthase (glutamine-hydrolysing)
MAASLTHRGPDEEGCYVGDGVGLAARRLSIVGIEDGQQPLFNEDRSVVAVFNGELFDYVKQRKELIARGHTFRTSTDGEILVHLWEDHGERCFERLEGQFAFVLYDLRKRALILARDRVGICPLHWTRVGQTLLFGSEIKSLLATELFDARPDLCGLDNIFTFHCMPGRRTAFAGVQSLRPGTYLRVDLAGSSHESQLRERTYWDFDFPDRGDERNPADDAALVDELDALMHRAIARRLRADVPVGVYLSGGVDSALMSAIVAQQLGGTFESFTARVAQDESELALRLAHAHGAQPHIVDCDAESLANIYPQVVAAADCPVVDTNAGSLYLLAQAVSGHGLKVVLAGEGADEGMAGYVWFKVHKFFDQLDWGAWTPFRWTHAAGYRYYYPRAPRGEFARINDCLGGYHAQTMVYHLTSAPRWILLRDEVLSEVQQEPAYDQLDFDRQRIRRWHPLNQSLYMGYKTMLPGLLLNHRGDRAAMASGVEVRYPFLDEAIIKFCSELHPRWKLRGVRGDKYLQRRLAARYLPPQDAWRTKKMFRAPFASTLLTSPPAYVRQLLSAESLNRSAYFKTDQVLKLERKLREGKVSLMLRLSFEMALCAVFGTQLWHHLYLGGGLCELPTWSPPQLV